MLTGTLIGCGTPSHRSDTTSRADGTEEAQLTERSEDIAAEQASDAERKRAEIKAQKIDVLQTQMAQVEQRHKDIAARVSEKQSDISALKSLLVTTENEMSAHEGKIYSYMSDNMMPIGCIGAAGVALDENNQFESDAEDIAAGVTFVCALALLDSAFATQVVNVVDTLNQADIYSKSLVQKAENIRAEIGEKANSLESDNTILTEADLKIQALESELDGLIFQ